MITLRHADALTLGAHVAAGSADLVYLDPPFAVGIAFGARVGKKGARAQGPQAYDDRWPSLEAYLDWLAPRLEAAYDVLAPEGSLWLHLDHRAIHEAHALAVSAFGRSRFLGEIIWLPGNGSKARKGPGVTHQTILIFGKGEETIWNAKDPALREPFAATSLSMHFKNVDADGRNYRERVIAGKAYRYYADEGRALGSVWSDCPAMVANTPLRKESTGYPTQKPEKLLDRIVRAASRPGGLVVDPFCGSGTTLVAAAKAGRRAVGLDVGALAIATTTERVRAAGFPLDAQ